MTQRELRYVTRRARKVSARLATSKHGAARLVCAMFGGHVPDAPVSFDGHSRGSCARCGIGMREQAS